MSWSAHDNIGKIEVVEVFGSDLTVVNAARVSFAKESKEMTDKDAGLIRYLAKHKHTSPFFHPQIPSADGLWERDPKLKQGSKDTSVEDADEIANEIEKAGEATIALYNSLLAKGVAPEIARSVLPQGMYTEFIETGSLAAYARLWELRTDPGAQREIQAYARGIEELLKPHFPVSWTALTSGS